MEVSPSTVSGATGEALTFTWDATRICQGLGMKDESATLVISKDGAVVTTRDLPDRWGTAHVKINLPGRYDVKLSEHTTCLNNTKSNPCSMDGFTQLVVETPSK
jgi:hypothetical protein